MSLGEDRTGTARADLPVRAHIELDQPRRHLLVRILHLDQDLMLADWRLCVCDANDHVSRALFDETVDTWLQIDGWIFAIDDAKRIKIDCRRSCAGPQFDRQLER